MISKLVRGIHNELTKITLGYELSGRIPGVHSMQDRMIWIEQRDKIMDNVRDFLYGDIIHPKEANTMENDFGKQMDKWNKHWDAVWGVEDKPEPIASEPVEVEEVEQ